MGTFIGPRMKTTRETALEQAQEDAPKIREHSEYGQRAFNALAVMVLDPRIREFLIINDPKALEQAREALGLPR